MSQSFVRERRVEAGPYRELKLYIRTFEQERRCKEPRGRRLKVTGTAQTKWNKQASKRKASLKLYANFGKGDYYLTFTYSNKFLPEKPEDAKRQKENVLKKMQRLYKKNNFELKYIWFTSYQFDEEVGYITRIHHHVITNKGPSRDDVEDCWSVGRGKKKQSLGRTQAKIIQPGEDGMQALVYYLTGQEKWEKRQWKKATKSWTCSQNLNEPYEATNDSKWSQRKLHDIGVSNDAGESLILKEFPDCRILGEIKRSYNEETGWYIKVELLKNDYG